MYTYAPEFVIITIQAIANRQRPKRCNSTVSTPSLLATPFKIAVRMLDVWCKPFSYFQRNVPSFRRPLSRYHPVWPHLATEEGAFVCSAHLKVSIAFHCFHVQSIPSRQQVLQCISEAQWRVTYSVRRGYLPFLPPICTRADKALCM